MKKSVYSPFAILLAMVLFLSVTACGVTSGTDSSSVSVAQAGSVESSKPAEPVTLTLWLAGLRGVDEIKKPQEEWVITKILRAFEAENPGVTIDVTVVPDQAQAHQTFKAAALAKNGPDIANLWAGYYVQQLKDAVLPLDDLVPQEDLENIYGWEGLREGLKPDGKILGYPIGGKEMTVFFYNKKLISDAGLDFENNPPKTTVEFDEALKKIKDTGVLPIANDEGAFANLLYFCNDLWWGQITTPAGLVRNNTKEQKFADDKGLIESLTYYQSLYTNGFVNSDAASSSDMSNKFIQGKAAMMIGGNWFITEAQEAMPGNVGIIKIPDMPNAEIKDSILGGVGQSLMVSNYTKHPEMCVKLMSFIDSKPNNIELLKVLSLIPLRKDITAEEVGFDKDPLLMKALEMSQKDTIYWVDNSVDPDAMNQLAKLAPLVLIGKMTPQAVAEEMDKEMAGK